MGLPDILGSIFKPVTDIVTKLIPDADKKIEATQQLAALQVTAMAQALEYEKTLAQEQGETIRAEATGHSWLQRNWRPILMLFFGVVIGWVIFHGAFDLQGRPIPETFVTYVLDIVKLGTTGYVLGRSAEKIMPTIAGAIKR